MDLTCFNPSAPSGLFTLFAVLVALVVGGWGTYLLMKKYPAEVDELRAKLRDLDDKRRG